MGTATIAGKEYQTAIMPDGKEWMAEHLQDAGAGGAWYGGSVANAALGRHYSEANVRAMAYPDGWRVPTYADMTNLLSLTGPSAGQAHRLSSPDGGWLAAYAINCTDDYGFHMTPTGEYFSDGWFFADRFGFLWYGLDHPTYIWALEFDATMNSIVRQRNNTPGTQSIFPVRLVRNASQMNLHVVHDGSWKRVSEQHQIDGEWVKSSKIFVPSSGAWAQS